CSSRRRHTRFSRDWSSDVCSSDLSASNAHDKDVMWGFISRYAPGVTAETHPELDRLTKYAIRYFDDFVKPNKQFREPDEVEREADRKSVGQGKSVERGGVRTPEKA